MKKLDTNETKDQKPARLIGSTGDVYEFSLGSVSLGRSDDNQIVLDSRKASRRHALIYYQAGDYFIQDLDSKNGTWLNGEKLTGSRVLRDGDRFKIGELEFTFDLSYNNDFTETASTFTTLLPLKISPLQIDFEAVHVRLNGRLLTPPLSPLEWKLLVLLYQQQNKVCSRDKIFEILYNTVDMSDIPLDTALETLVSRLRKRLEMTGPNRLPYIRAVRGTGYRLEI